MDQKKNTPLGETAILIFLILSKIVVKDVTAKPTWWGFIDRTQQDVHKVHVEQDRINREKKRERKCTKKGGLGLLDIQQFINGLNLIWIHNFF